MPYFAPPAWYGYYPYQYDTGPLLIQTETCEERVRAGCYAAFSQDAAKQSQCVQRGYARCGSPLLGLGAEAAGDCDAALAACNRKAGGSKRFKAICAALDRKCRRGGCVDLQKECRRRAKTASNRKFCRGLVRLCNANAAKGGGAAAATEKAAAAAETATAEMPSGPSPLLVGALVVGAAGLAWLAFGRRKAA